MTFNSGIDVFKYIHVLKYAKAMRIKNDNYTQLLMNFRKYSVKILRHTHTK